jgi:hypothetical protein
MRVSYPDWLKILYKQNDGEYHNLKYVSIFTCSEATVGLCCTYEMVIWEGMKLCLQN